MFSASRSRIFEEPVDEEQEDQHPDDPPAHVVHVMVRGLVDLDPTVEEGVDEVRRKGEAVPHAPPERDLASRERMRCVVVPPVAGDHRTLSLLLTVTVSGLTILSPNPQ